jgi:hypothetical protein
LKLVEVFKEFQTFKISVFVAKFMEPKKRFSSAIVSGGGQDYRWEGRKKYVAT